MMDRTSGYDISVVLATYNRRELLELTLASLLAQDVGALRYEVIVVDNNSADDTRQAVESIIAQGHDNLRYLFEGRQGVSYARNAGVAAASAEVVAFTDDDIQPARDWLATIAASLARYPQASFVGGKVLPDWEAPPPRWLNKHHWSPLPVVDYGDQPIRLHRDRPLCVVTANLAVRKQAFLAVGGLAIALQRVKDSIGSTEDHDLLLRLFRLGHHGWYDPTVRVQTAVPVERMSKAYHRRWHTGNGYFCALMNFEEFPADSIKLFGTAGYFYLRIPQAMAQWLVAAVRRREADAFEMENRVRYLASYIRTVATSREAAAKRPMLAEIVGFARALVARKLRARGGAGV